MPIRVPRALLSFLGLGPLEFARTWPLACCYAATLLSLYVQKPVRNALFLDVLGVERLPLVLLGVALLGGVAAIGIARFSRRVQLARALPLVLLSGGLVLAGFRFWLGASSAVAIFAFYLVANLFGQIATSLLWLWASESFDARVARRVFGLIAGAGIFGAFLGGMVTQYCVARMGTLDLLWLAVAGWFVALGFSLIGKQGGGAGDGWRAPSRTAPVGELWSSPLVRTLLLGAMATAAASALVDLQWNAIVDRAFDRAEDKAAFFGAFFAWLNLAAFAFQILLAPALLRRFGLGASVLLLPVSLLGGALLTLIYPVVASGVAMKSADVGLRHSLGRSVTEVLFAPLPPDVRVRARVLLDALFDNLGTGLGAALGLLLLSRAEAGLSALSVATLAMALLALAFAVRLRPAYVQALRQGLLRRQIQPQALGQVALGASTRDMLLDSLSSDNPRQVDYAIDVLREAEALGLEAELRPLLGHEQALIRKQALRFLAAQASDPSDDARRLLDDPDPAVRAEALRVLARHGPSRAQTLREYLASDDPARWQAALSCVAESPAVQDVELLTPALFERLSGTPHEEHLVSAVGRCMLEYGEPDRSKWLIARLEDGQTRGAATRALAALGPAVHAALERSLSEPGAAVARVLARGTDRASRRLLFGELLRRPPVERAELLLACVERRRRDQLRFPRSGVDRLVASEIAWFQELSRVTATVIDRLGQSSRLLGRVLSERMEDSRVRLLRTLSLSYPFAELNGAELALRSSDPSARGRALELLDETLRPEHRIRVLSVFEPVSRSSAVRGDLAVALRWLGEQPDAWLRRVARFETEPSPKESGAANVASVLGLVEKVLLLQSVDAFVSATSEQLSLVAAIASEHRHQPGDSLYRESDPADAMYVVVEGRVKLERRGQEVGLLGPAEAFGTWSLFEPEPRLTSAVVLEPTLLLRIDRIDFLDVLADHVDLSRAILASVARRLRAVLGRTGP